MKKILIDTDIGDDIDDALAIAYALNSKELDVIGITTAFRNVEKRAQLVLQQLNEYGKPEIPVAIGIGDPFITPADTTMIPAHWDDEAVKIENNCGMHAVDFIIETIKKYPDAAIAAIAPLTNIACAVRKAPEVMEEADIWVMGGMYSEPYPEWNIQCDPEAAAIVFGKCKKAKIIGLDVTLKCRLTKEQVEALFKSKDENTKLLRKWTKSWMDSSQHVPILHDPLVIAAIEAPELIQWQAKEIHVECSGKYLRGVTAERTDPFFRTPQKPNVKMAVGVDEQQFIKMFLANVFPDIK